MRQQQHVLLTVRSDCQWPTNKRTVPRTTESVVSTQSTHVNFLVSGFIRATTCEPNDCSGRHARKLTLGPMPFRNVKSIDVVHYSRLLPAVDLGGGNAMRVEQYIMIGLAVFVAVLLLALAAEKLLH